MPQMFHLRKPRSLESVSSNDSSSTVSTAAMPRTPIFPAADHHHHYHNDARRTRIAELDPLSLHPTNYCHQQKPPPPRLADRAFIRADGPAEVFQPHPRSPGTPPGFLKMDDADEQDLEGNDDEPFALRLDRLPRPMLARSRWSESTVHTLSDNGSDLDDEEEGDHDGEEQQDDDDDTDDDDTTAAGGQSSLADLDFGFERQARVPRTGGWENFSYKRNTVAAVARRRPVEAGNVVDDYVKRGVWKRRGIVFQNGDSSSVVDRLSARTVG